MTLARRKGGGGSSPPSSSASAAGGEGYATAFCVRDPGSWEAVEGEPGTGLGPGVAAAALELVVVAVCAPWLVWKGVRQVITRAV